MDSIMLNLYIHRYFNLVYYHILLFISSASVRSLSTQLYEYIYETKLHFQIARIYLSVMEMVTTECKSCSDPSVS